MSWTALTVEWTKEATRNLRGLPAKDVAQIVATVDAYAATGVADIKKLQGQPGYRIRVRERRVIVDVIFTAKTVRVLAVTTRGDAY